MVLCFAGLVDAKMVDVVQRTPNPSLPSPALLSDQYVESCFEDPFPHHSPKLVIEDGEGSKVTVDPPIVSSLLDVSTLSPSCDDSSLTSGDTDTNGLSTPDRYSLEYCTLQK